MYLSIIILPFLGSIVAGFFGRKVGVRGAQIITGSCVIVTTILALLALIEVGFNNNPVTIYLFKWIDSEWFNITSGFQFDALTVSMLIPVLIISSLVHIYSIGYMSGDPRGYVKGKRNRGDKLSNSGDSLKLKVPSYSLKTISGWSNYSDKVTSLKICENKMDNRGSKSIVLKSMIVKEQRVDGSWSTELRSVGLRCTLLGFERNRGINLGFNLQQGWNSGVKIPSKQYEIRKFSTYISSPPANKKNVFFFITQGSKEPVGTGFIHPWVWSGLIIFLTFRHIVDLGSGLTMCRRVKKIYFFQRKKMDGSFGIVVDRNKTRKLQLSGWLLRHWGLSLEVQRSLTSLWSREINKSRLQPVVMLKSSCQTRSNQLIIIKNSTCIYLNFWNTISLSSLLPFSALYSAEYSLNKERQAYWATMYRYSTHKSQPLLPNKLSLRWYSTTKKVGGAPLDNFYEWFCGLTDGESSFYIKSTGSRTFSFRFQICLHKDDLEMLKFIQKTLGMGRIFTSRSQSYYDVTKQEDLAKIIDIFDNFPLNTHKHFNFLDLKKAYELYVSSKEKTLGMALEINTIRKGMNTQRSYFGITESRKFRITPYWVLGFIEGEGSFHILKKDYYPRFSVGQSVKDLALMEELKNYFNSLERELPHANLTLNLEEGGSPHQEDVAYLSIDKKIDMVNLAISQKYFITNVLIPFFDSLSWQSKKEKDFQDWKAITNIRNLGLHYTDKGVEIIKLILSQMNGNRLSSKSRSTPVIDRALLQLEIEKLLMEGSNFEEKEDGRIFIKSLKKFLPPTSIGIEVKDKEGLVLNTFASLSECAKFLGVSSSTAVRRLRKSEPLLVNGKLIYIYAVKVNYS